MFYVMKLYSFWIFLTAKQKGKKKTQQPLNQHSDLEEGDDNAEEKALNKKKEDRAKTETEKLVGILPNTF